MSGSGKQRVVRMFSLLACIGGLCVFMWHCSPMPGESVENSTTDGGSSTETGHLADGDAVDGGHSTETSSPRDNAPPTERSAPGPDTSAPDNTSTNSACSGFWPDVTKTYADATNLKSCDEIAAAQPVVKSLMNLAGVTIANNGAKMTPCIDVRCDDSWVYVVSNALPHYDFVPTTPNPLKTAVLFYRVAMQKRPIVSGVDAEDLSAMKGCQSAYTTYVSNPGSATNREPSGYCIFNASDKPYMTTTYGGKQITYRKISCLGTIGFAITGVPVFGPNEGPMPDAWGNPVFFSPDKAGEPYVPNDPRGGAALDLCLGHTAQTMHYHGFNEACFERKPDGSPKLSYAAATSTWDYQASLAGDCPKESGIVGWSQDGVPIKGPCVCVKRNSDGSCASVKRARSGFVYRGLKAWGSSSQGNTVFAKEGSTCTQLSDCCANNNNCRYMCKYTVVDDAQAAGGTTVGKRCVLRDYTWCVHHFVDRSQQDVSNANFVYLDRCNGFEGADGYAYHATTTFPHVLGCNRYEAKDALGTGAGHGGNNNNNNNQRCRRDQDCQQGQRCVQGSCQGGNNNNNNNNQGPPPCNSDNDCRTACPNFPKGCKCTQTPQHGKACIPACSTASDCPQDRGRMTCGQGGICIPQGGGAP